MKKSTLFVLSALMIISAMHEPSKESVHEPKIKCEKNIDVMEKASLKKKKPKKVEIVEEKQEKQEEIVEITISDEEWNMINLCVEAEAGNQDLKGKRLVADVILNRVESDRFPNNICDVITQKYQFSTYWDGAMDRAEPSEETNEAVRMELESRIDDKILFFTAGGYNRYCVPAYKYGDHYFGY